MLEKLGVQEHHLEEKLVTECLQRERWNLYCLLKMSSPILYVLRVPSQKAMAHQGEQLVIGSDQLLGIYISVLFDMLLVLLNLFSLVIGVRKLKVQRSFSSFSAYIFHLVNTLSTICDL